MKRRLRSHDRVIRECGLLQMRGNEQLNTNMAPPNVHSAHLFVHVGQEEYCMKIAPIPRAIIFARFDTLLRNLMFSGFTVRPPYCFQSSPLMLEACCGAGMASWPEVI